MEQIENSESSFTKETVRVLQKAPPEKKQSLWEQKKIAILILILIIIAFVIPASAYFFLDHKNTETITMTIFITPKPTYTNHSNSLLKTYTNPTYGYSFQYPATWSVEVQSPNYIVLHKQIVVTTETNEPTSCQEDCPLLQKTDMIKLGTNEWSIYDGERTARDTTPKYFKQFVLRDHDLYISFIVYGQKMDPHTYAPSNEHVTNEQINQMISILSTVSFPKTIISKKFFSADEAGNFPIYPGAKFIQKETFPLCELPQELRCNTNEYSWETTTDGDTVKEWYQDQTKHPKWDCSKVTNGWYADKRSFAVSSICEHEGNTYTYLLLANQLRTKIILSLKNP